MKLMVADLSVAWPFKIANVRFWAKFCPTPTKDRKKVVFEMGYCQKWMSIVENRSFPKQYVRNIYNYDYVDEVNFSSVREQQVL